MRLFSCPFRSCQVVASVASSGSSEQLAVASIVTFDIYKRYINADASGHQVSVHRSTSPTRFPLPSDLGFRVQGLEFRV